MARRKQTAGARKQAADTRAANRATAAERRAGRDAGLSPELAELPRVRPLRRGASPKAHRSLAAYAAPTDEDGAELLSDGLTLPSDVGDGRQVRYRE